MRALEHALDGDATVASLVGDVMLRADSSKAHAIIHERASVVGIG